MKTESRKEVLDRLNELVSKPRNEFDHISLSIYTYAKDLLKLANAQEELIEKYAEALGKIANFTHLPKCTGKNHVPIYECSCIDKRDDQWRIARKALADASMGG